MNGYKEMKVKQLGRTKRIFCYNWFGILKVGKKVLFYLFIFKSLLYWLKMWVRRFVFIVSFFAQKKEDCLSLFFFF